NTYTLDFAETLIREEKLGKSGFTDVLCISLSSTDYIAHRFGPNSLEAEDTYLRLDKELEKFFLMLDAYAGKGNYLLFLTADHGASAIPGFYQEHKMPGGNLKMNSVRLELNKVLKTTFGQDSLVPKIIDYQVYLDEARIRKASLDRDKVKVSVMSFFRDRPEVLMVFDYDHLAETIMQASIKEKLINGYYARRSGAIQVLLKPNYDDVDWSGTEHGTIYNYDTHIPLIFYGWHIPKGKTYRPVSMTDIAPTISALLQIQSPSGSIGKVLEEIVK
ncbi:MAG: alkaline phosphatase family protein, partial [Ferruginibacter sp.]